MLKRHRSLESDDALKGARHVREGAVGKGPRFRYHLDDPGRSEQSSVPRWRPTSCGAGMIRRAIEEHLYRPLYFLFKKLSIGLFIPFLESCLFSFVLLFLHRSAVIITSLACFCTKG